MYIRSFVYIMYTNLEISSLWFVSARSLHVRYNAFSYRFAEEVLNSKLSVKREIESVLTSGSIDMKSLSRPNFNQVLRVLFTEKGWEDQPTVFDEQGDPTARMDFLKDRVGIEVEFGHSSFIGIDLLKFQVASCSGLNKIDLGVYVTTTKEFQKRMKTEFSQNWEGSLSYEKVVRYLPHLKSAIQVPVWVIGLLPD